MRRLLAIVLAALAVPMLFAAPTFATDSVTATATVSGATILAQVSGIADDCGSSDACSGQAVAVVVQPDAEAFALCNGNVGTGVVAEQSMPATGGSFSVSAAVTEPEGTYAVCGSSRRIVMVRACRWRRRQVRWS
jgi:hypothetical protein